jgi:phosphohistidine phosphatase
MMISLYINRHAKSSWDSGARSDFDRPLNDRGLRDAPAMAQKLLERGDRIDAIYSSPANRALSTARLFAKALGIHPSDIIEVSDIYEANLRTLCTFVENIDDHHKNVMIFGHNPGFSNLANHLCDQNIYMPTCGSVKVNFAIDSWRLVSQETGSMEWFDAPKF